MALRDSITEKTGLPLGMVAGLVAVLISGAGWTFALKADVGRNAEHADRLESRLQGVEAQFAATAKVDNDQEVRIRLLENQGREISEIKADVKVLLLQRSGIHQAGGR